MKVVVPLKYKAASKLRKQKEKYEKAKVCPPSPFLQSCTCGSLQALLSFPHSQLTTEGEDNIRQLEKLAESEQKDNEIELARQFGKNVTYGQIIQLRHVLTGTNVKISTSDAAQLEVLDLAVQLSSANSKRKMPCQKFFLGGRHQTPFFSLLDCYLKILPRFKVRAEGEPVRFTDQVMFESVKMPSRFLSFSPGTFTSGINTGAHEMDLSIRSSAFNILYSYSIDKKRAKFLKGGDVVYLLHKELDSYLAAEGIFTDKSMLEKIHLRSKPRSELQDLDTASTDGATFFQVEVENDVTDGDPIQWETNVRLRHMISKRYLQVKNEKLSLTKDKVIQSLA